MESETGRPSTRLGTGRNALPSVGKTRDERAGNRINACVRALEKYWIDGAGEDGEDVETLVLQQLAKLKLIRDVLKGEIDEEDAFPGNA